MNDFLNDFFANEENEKLLEELSGEKRSISGETVSKMANFLILSDFNGRADYRDILPLSLRVL